MGDYYDPCDDELIDLLPDPPIEPQMDEADREFMESVANYAPHLSDDLRRVHLYCRLVAQIEADRDTARKNITKIMCAIDAQAGRRLESLKRSYGAEVRQAVAKMLDGTKAKSIATPFGRCGFREVPRHLEIVDASKLLDEFEAGKLPAEWIRTKHEVNKAALNEHFAKTGEIPPGCDCVQAVERFYP